MPSPTGAAPAIPPRFIRPTGTLRGLVPSTIGYEPDPDDVAPIRAGRRDALLLHRGLPSPYLTLIFSLAGPVTSGETPEQARGDEPVRTRVVLGGLHTRPAYVVADPDQAGVQLAVHPLAARAILGVPASELQVLVTEGADVLGPEADRLRERMVEVGWHQRFALLGGYLRRQQERVAGHTRVRPEVAEAWRLLQATGGRAGITCVADHVALSPRQLRALFVREVGLGPKAVARLMRFERATRAIGKAVCAATPLDLTRVAHDSGYADLSHLDREFVEFAGTGPRAWVAEERRNLQAGGHAHGSDSEP